MVRSTTIRPFSVTSSPPAAAMGPTANPAVHTVASEARALPSAHRTRVASTASTHVCSRTEMPSRSQARRRWLRAPAESRAPSSSRAISVTDRPGRVLGDLGGGLDAGQPVADDQHTPALVPPAQAVQALAQAQRRGPAGDVEGVLGHAGDAVVGDVAAERVEKRVVTELVAAVGAGHGDGLALGVDGGDTGQAQPYPRAREDVGELWSLNLPAGRELVQPQPLDEVRLGVDDGDPGVRRGQPAGQVPGRVGPGIARAEDDDVVLHVLLLSVRLLLVT